MLLADEARAYLDRQGRADRDSLEPIVRVSFSCESLKVTTRLMHVIAWLLTQRAVEAGGLSGPQARPPAGGGGRVERAPGAHAGAAARRGAGHRRSAAAEAPRRSGGLDRRQRRPLRARPAARRA